MRLPPATTIPHSVPVVSEENPPTQLSSPSSTSSLILPAPPGLQTQATSGPVPCLGAIIGSVFGLGNSLLTGGSQVVTIGGNSYSVVDGQTAVAGAHSITISGSQLGLRPLPIAIATSGAAGPVSETTITGYIIDGQTLVPGAPAITVSEKTVSLDSLATAAVVDGSTITAAYPTVAQPPPVVIVGTQMVTADPALRYIINGQTLTPGESAVTISGSVVAFAPVPSNTMSKAPVMTDGTQLVTADSASHFIVGSQTITKVQRVKQPSRYRVL